MCASRIECWRSEPGRRIRLPCSRASRARSGRSRSFQSWLRVRPSCFGDLGLNNVHVRLGDGYSGWPEQAPFDRIMVTAAPDEIPDPLIEQLAVGGRLVIPVGSQGGPQWMTVVEKSSNGVVQNRTIPVQFVPLTRDRKQSG